MYITWIAVIFVYFGTLVVYTFAGLNGQDCWVNCLLQSGNSFLSNNVPRTHKYSDF